eukprot:TRINITY_DN26913_c0_g1_i1.p1 TRINITY_DN26913_c0_g1~~TRINITY_DN26913_c0_g1_i1.p1  ORF type:complete len:714 (+),score=207.01 TRINITY_DN26913_c0_g1_i1:132-2273(+)
MKAAEPAGSGQQAAAEPTGDAATKAPEQPKAAVEEQRSFRSYFSPQPLPWWLVFFLGIFLLAKFQLVYNDSPCAVLGTQGPVSQTDIKRAFRQLSMCTHPDRLRGRLKREPTPAELRRGEIIFNRASAAKDEISKVLSRRIAGKKKRRKKGKAASDDEEHDSSEDNVRIACYEGELEMAIFGLLQQAGISVSSLGIYDYFALARDFVWSICTFEAGIMSTILSLLWLGFVWRMAKQFLGYLWGMGVLRFLVSLFTTTVIGPFPTILYFAALPLIRLVAFLQISLGELTARPADIVDSKKTDDVKPDDEPASADDAKNGKDKKDGPSSAKMAVATDKVDRNALRNRRPKKETDEEKEKKNKDLLLGEGKATEPAVPDKDAWVQNAPVPEGIWNVVNWGHKEPIKARAAASAAVQFDVLLILTKPIIPLAMLISLGQVFNGLFSSMFVGWVLRSWLPTMGFETHHLLVSFFGMAHTLLGVTASQVEDHAQREGALLHLKWAWSFKDVLCVMHMALLGSSVTCISGLGNEPSYAASFASGIALRIFLAKDGVQTFPIVKYIGSAFETSLRNAGFVMESGEEVAVYSGGGIGDCGGGPFRMLFGEEMAGYCAMALKAWLMIMPVLSTIQWAQRSLKAGRMMGRNHKTMRLLQRVTLCGLGLLQCYMIMTMELNAFNGALGNFWVAMLFGCVAESLMSIYDVRGQVKQLLFLLLFLLI